MEHSSTQRASYRGEFRDAAVYDPTQKTAVSVRDGVIEYSGAELGIEPEDKMFSVYRSPATISNTAMRMRGLPLTPEHVSLDQPAPSDAGFVSDAHMVDAHDENTHTTIAIRNQLTLSDTMREMVDAGRREMSLGYRADLVPHDVYDFEQKDIKPHHLATVPEGRCGPMCSFLDALPTDDGNTDMNTVLHKSFQDAEGGMNLQQVVELASALPEAIKQVPIDKLSELTEPLQNIMAAAQERGVEGGGEDTTATADADTDDTEDDEEEGQPMSDEKIKQEVERRTTEHLDAAVKRHTETVEKARHFLPSDYGFADKSTPQIMRDTLATKTNEQFTDEQLPLAFKMLERPAPKTEPTDRPYRHFGDESPATTVDSIADKEIGG